MKAPVSFIAILLVSCSSSPTEKAERQYSFLASQNSSAAEMCSAARRVQEAYRDAQNADKYQEWRLTADVDCRKADQQNL